MKKLLLIVFGLSLFALLSCGKKDDYKYSLTENGCETGEHEADSKDEMCTQLKNNDLNKSCASNLRKEKYEADGCGKW